MISSPSYLTFGSVAHLAPGSQQKTRLGCSPSRSLVTRGTLIALVLTLLSACTYGSKPQQRQPAPTGKATEALKPMGAGLYYYADEAGQRFPFVDHAVVGGAWADFEPRPGDFSGPGWGRLDAALRAYPNYKFRLRIMAGRLAPDWVKRLSGGCVTIVQPDNRIPSCVPRFWTRAYLNTYQRFMTEVARRYDREPRILDIVNSACMTTWAEPFIRTGFNARANMSLWAAGLNETSDRYCFRQSMAIMDRSFRSTRISLATHTVWQLIVDPDVVHVGMRPSWPKERNLLNELRSRYGAKLVIQNNGLGGAEGCTKKQPLSSATSMWCWLASLPAPKGFQTEGDSKLASAGFTADDAVRRAIDMGGCFVERNQFGRDEATVAALNQQLKANCPGSS
jgi:hypothetical protein